MRFLDAEFVKGFMRMATDGWNMGWHERNGGNLSYRVKPIEVEEVKEELIFLLNCYTNFRLLKNIVL